MLSRIAWVGVAAVPRTTAVPLTRSTVTDRQGAGVARAASRGGICGASGRSARGDICRADTSGRPAAGGGRPGRPQIVGEPFGEVVAVKAGGVKDAGHGPGAGPGDHVHDNAVLLQRLEHAEVGHAAGGSAAEGHADADAAEVVDEPFQPGGQRSAPGRRCGASMILKSRQAKSRRFGTTGATVPPSKQPGDADLVAPAAGRHAQRLQAADGRILRGRRDEVHRAIDERHEPPGPFRLPGPHATSKMMRLASCHSAACRRISSRSSIWPSTAKRPEPHVRHAPPRRPNR